MKPSHRFRQAFLLLCLSLALSMLTGCGPSTYPVEGTVVFEDGSPAKELAGYVIMFQSEDKQKSANGLIRADGSFSIGTFKDDDGALQGKQRVAIAQAPQEVDAPRKPSLILARYSSFEKSGLEIEVKSGKNNPTFTVERVKR